MILFADSESSDQNARSLGIFTYIFVAFAVPELLRRLKPYFDGSWEHVAIAGKDVQ